jgi:Kef-type K+ transport system membrane component KefB
LRVAASTTIASYLLPAVLARYRLNHPGLALLASLISVRLGVSIALVEIAVGNLWEVPETQWTDFLASIGAVILTFLAGVDIDTKVLKSKL